MTAPLSHAPGDRVGFEQQPYIVVRRVRSKGMLCRHAHTGSEVLLPFQELRPAPDAPPPRPMPDLDSIDEATWQRRLAPKLEVIQELQAIPEREFGRAAIVAVVGRLRARGIKVSVTSAYRWWSLRHDLAALLRDGRRDRGQRRFPLSVQHMVEFALQRYVLNEVPTVAIAPEVLAVLDRPLQPDLRGHRRRTPMRRVLELTELMFNAASVPVHERPHPNTIALWARQLEEERRMDFAVAQGGPRGRKAITATRGHHTVQRAGQEWQVDHTRTDVHLVHRHTNTVIGRAWITLIIDVCTRLVVGWYVTLESPSRLSVGLALSRAILPKTGLMQTYDLEAPWECWGVPGLLHMDNAGEFRSHDLKRFSGAYHFHLRWRPIPKPEYGGHIERLMGTFAARFKGLPGATLGNPQALKNAGYDAQGNALYTIDQFDRWVAQEIEKYNHTWHAALECTPWERYEAGIFGPGGISTGALYVGDSARRLEIDALPSAERTVQREGIKWDHLSYFSDVLRTRVLDGRKYTVRRDPRNISTIQFYNPDDRQYYELHTRTTSHGAVSIWEVKRAVRSLTSARQKVTPQVLMNTVRKQNAIDQEALHQRGSARMNERRAQHALATPKTAPASAGPASAPAAPGPGSTLDLSDLTPRPSVRRP